ncbi:MAG: glutamate-1-semialdehyde 2,1-aminomutase [Candidatus Schekmanbacteria bacterium]|nr:glutamate-1-semialdehyde 2,1-aminomutase [Candidatus Schekmanbacteria bacterium]
MTAATSTALFSEAQELLPGGVNSPVRSFASVGGSPFFVERASGATIWDVEGKSYIDYVGSYGPMILGHAAAPVVAAIARQAEKGTSFGAPTALEVDMARVVTACVPSVAMVRFVSSGTEATMSAIRLARAFTKRRVIVKCEGCYHGHGDAFLSRAGSGLATLGLSSSPGVPEAFAALTVTIPFNDAAALRAALDAHGDDVAAFIVEPVPANMGVVLPRSGYLEEIRELTASRGVLLIFDEVISGFRLGLGGAQAHFGVMPDLTCLGKIIGGGLPVGAYGGRKDIMQMVAPCGPVYQAGTLSGNPLAMRAGLETIAHLKLPETYERLATFGEILASGLREAATRHSWPLTVNQLGSIATPFFVAGGVASWDDARRADTGRFSRFHRELLNRGVFLAPSQFEAMFLSTAHSALDVEATLRAMIAAAATVF